jgi:hypothetical protein
MHARTYLMIRTHALAIVVVACATLPGEVLAQRAAQGAKPVATASTAMASSSHPLVTQAILDVLRDGGNAVDAMLTAMKSLPMIMSYRQGEWNTRA